MRHDDVILTVQLRHGSTCGQRADDVRLFVFYLSLGLVRVCEKELSHMGKNSGNLDLVCENNCLISFTQVFSCRYCWVLIFVLSPFYILIYSY